MYLIAGLIPACAELGGQPVAQPGPDVGESRVAGRVRAVSRCQQVLAGAFGDDDDRVVASSQALLEHVEHAAVAGQREGHFRDEAQVDVGPGQGGGGGDEAGVAAHQLHEADAVPGAARFGVRGADGAGGGLDGGGEPEAALDPIHVVVDRFGNANHRQSDPPGGGFGRDRGRPPQGSIATDAKQDRHPVALEGVDHRRRILRTSRRGQDRPTVGMHIGDVAGGELERGPPVSVGQPGEAVAVPEDPAHPVPET
jgi:hypothetical protein